MIPTFFKRKFYKHENKSSYITSDSKGLNQVRHFAIIPVIRGEWVILSRRAFFIEEFFRGIQSPPPRNFNDFLSIVYQSRNPRRYTIFCIFCMLRKIVFFFSHSLAFSREISPKLMKIETKTYKFNETVGKINSIF